MAIAWFNSCKASGYEKKTFLRSPFIRLVLVRSRNPIANLRVFVMTAGWRVLGFSAYLFAAVACAGADGDTTSTGGHDGDSRVLPDAGKMGVISPTATCDGTYALCAAAECFVYNLVAYCKCDILDGKSISAPFYYTDSAGEQTDICDVDAQGLAEGAFMASTFSLPVDVVKGRSLAAGMVFLKRVFVFQCCTT